MSGPKIHFPTEEEKQAGLLEFFERQKRVNEERRLAAILGLEALDRLAKVCCERSGQPYKVRSFLYSLWNGKPASLIEVVGLDWEIRRDLTAVILAFGFEQRGIEFFYAAMETALKKVGQWEWFLAERFECKQLRLHLEAVERTIQVEGLP